MASLFSFVLRLFLLLAGLVFAISLALAVAVLLLGWGLRSLWARLTGRRVAPFVMRIDPRDGFAQVYRRAGGAPGSAGHGSAAPTLHDVTDVEPKSPRR
jgi:hypothetical protein